MSTSLFRCLAIVALLFMTSQVNASPLHSEGFEDPLWVSGIPDNWQDFGGATIVRAPTGTNGVTSASGVAHATLTPGNGPFTRFDGYQSNFGQGFKTSLDVFLDPSAMAAGDGFDYSVAASKQDGTHLRDFIYHVGVVGTDLLVNASNNTDFTVNAFKLNTENGGNNFTVTGAGWYTLEHVFRDDAGALAVDFNLRDDLGNLLHSITRSDLSDDIATTVGGNRYGWFTVNNINNLPIDNTNLQYVVPEPTSAALLFLGTIALTSVRRRRAA